MGPIFGQVVANVRKLAFRGIQRERSSCSLVQRRNFNQDRKFIPRRAALYIPGNDERKLKKIEGLDVDCVVMDCEDGVALNRKVMFTLYWFTLIDTPTPFIYTASLNLAECQHLIVKPLKFGVIFGQCG